MLLPPHLGLCDLVLNLLNCSEVISPRHASHKYFLSSLFDSMAACFMAVNIGFPTSIDQSLRQVVCIDYRISTTISYMRLFAVGSNKENLLAMSRSFGLTHHATIIWTVDVTTAVSDMHTPINTYFARSLDDTSHRYGAAMKQLVLCIDATGYRFNGDESDSNILKIFRVSTKYFYRLTPTILTLEDAQS